MSIVTDPVESARPYAIIDQESRNLAQSVWTVLHDSHNTKDTSGYLI